MTELWRLNAAQLTQGYRNGDFTPGEVLDACLARVAEWQPHSNAALMTDKGGAKLAASASRLRWARGTPLSPMDGVPVMLQDTLHASGLPTTWGSRLLQGFVPRRDELPVARLRAAGAVIFGKTQVPEFALQDAAPGHGRGVARNPWNTALTPGPCGGAAAAVATGCGPLGMATDAGGSLRRPAALCGVVGFLASQGRVPRDGGLPAIFLQFEGVGAVGRHVQDVQDMMHVAADPAPANAAPAAPTRILHVPRFGGRPVDPAITDQVTAAAAQLQALGPAVEQAASFTLADRISELWPQLAQAGLAWMMERADSVPEFGLRTGESPDLAQCSQAARAALEAGRALRTAAMFDLLTAVQTLQRELAELFTRYDFILTPASAALAWPAAQTHPDRIDDQPVGPRGHAVFTAFANAAGLPAIALPCGRAGRLPVGMQLVARPGADAQLLALALQYEQAHPWQAHWPELPI